MQEVQSAADYNHFIYRDFICQIVWEGGSLIGSLFYSLADQIFLRIQ